MIKLPKAYKILDKKEKSKFNSIIFLNILNFLIELSCLLSVPIFTSILLKQKNVLEKISDYLPLFIIENIIFYAALTVVFLFLLKNLFILFLTLVQNTYLKSLKIKLSSYLFENYLFSSYESHANVEPASVSRNVSTIIQEFSNYLTHMINMSREISTIVMIFLVLIYLNPFTITLIILFLSSCTIIYFKKIKPKIETRSKENQKLNKKFTQMVYESFGAIKDLKIFQKEKDIFNIFKNRMQIFEKNLLFFLLFEKFPRLILEIASITFILFVSIFVFSYDKNLDDVLPILALIVISVIRLLPAFTSLNNSMYYMRILAPSVDILSKEIIKTKEESKKNEKNLRKKEIVKKNFDLKKSLITLEDVSFNYSNSSKIIPLKNINMHIEAGDIVGVTGKTGSGKTTLMNLILGLLEPSNGNIFYKNENIQDIKSEWQKNISFVSQNIFLFDDTIEKNITFNFKDDFVDKNKIKEAIEVSHLSEKIKQLPQGLKTKVGNDGIMLSGGEKQRIAIARAIYKDSNVLFLDEFTSAIDQKTESSIIKKIQSNYKNKILIIIAHRSSTLSMCKNIWHLEDGKIKKQ